MTGPTGTSDARRTEHEVFDELASVCSSQGYAHAIAHLCFRDNIVRYADEVTADDVAHMSSMKSLSRTEISTLIGLMVKSPIDFTMPSPQVMQEYITRTDNLLAELHEIMSLEAFQAQDWKKIMEEGGSPFQRGQVYREPIFYGGESAYLFQYLDLAGRKYAADDHWMERCKGFTIETAQSVVRAAGTIQSEKLQARLDAMRQLPPREWTILPAHVFAADEVAQQSGIDIREVERILESFALPVDETNQGFAALDDFNVANALPLLRVNQSEFLLFQGYNLVEALYEAPFYWMSADKAYRAAAMNNRGRFAEAFSAERLRRVFGTSCVHTNIDIYESKDRRLGEVDVLVIFANRAIVLQAKSKRLTLEARKGNDQVIKDDFKKSVQDSYDQGRLCASALTDTRYRFVGAMGAEIAFDRDFKEVYILCVVSDHYPALSFQTRQFLKHEETKVIKPPFVLDVFTLDAVTEMLESPLRFLSYLHRRTLYADRLLASQELTILSYHLKQNLWLDDEHTMFMLGEDVSADLDVAMAARRDGIPGKATPEGILTRHAGTTLWRLIEDIETRADPGTIDLGFMLLMLSGDTIKDANRLIDQAVAKTRRDGQTHDVTICLGDTGFTLHCNGEPINAAMPPLRRHCENRKYTERVDSWFGVCLDPRDARMRFGVCLDYPWKQLAAMDEATKHLPKPTPGIKAAMQRPTTTPKVGRNDPCPCGSGKKYKKCCLN
jgi:hypothetical protein